MGRARQAGQPWACTDRQGNECAAPGNGTFIKLRDAGFHMRKPAHGRQAAGNNSRLPPGTQGQGEGLET